MSYEIIVAASKAAAGKTLSSFLTEIQVLIKSAWYKTINFNIIAMTRSKQFDGSRVAASVGGQFEYPEETSEPEKGGT